MKGNFIDHIQEFSNSYFLQHLIDRMFSSLTNEWGKKDSEKSKTILVKEICERQTEACCMDRLQYGSLFGEPS